MIYPNEKQLATFKKTEGALSVHEMLAIMNVVGKAPNGVFLECGSHRGKSGTATAAAMSLAHGSKLHLVDPLYNLDNLEAWKHSCQGHPDNAWCGAKDSGFHDEVKGAIREASEGLVEAVLHGDFSTHAISAIHAEYGDFAYVLLDTDVHTYELTKQELELLRDRMMVGGLLGFHDWGSQFVGVEQAYREMLSGGMYEEFPIDWEAIKQWVANHGGEEGNRSWHHNEMEAPCFYAALIRVK